MTPENIRVGIVDDERLARERLVRIIEATSDMRVVFACADGVSGLDATLHERPDLLFLDLQMPGASGLDVARELLNYAEAGVTPLVVFVTAYDEHALHAFETHALDYIVKPFDDERLISTLERVRVRVRQQRLDAAADRLRSMLEQTTLGPGSSRRRPAAEDAATPETHSGLLERFVLRTAGRVRLLHAGRVDWIAAEGVYARLHIGSESFLVRIPMHELEARLDPRLFARIHRSTIVNLDRIAELQEHIRGEFVVILVDGTTHRLSRSRKAHLEALLGQSL